MYNVLFPRFTIVTWFSERSGPKCPNLVMACVHMPCMVKQFIVPLQNQHGKDDISESELLADRDSGPAEWSPCNAGGCGPHVHGPFHG